MAMFMQYEEMAGKMEGENAENALAFSEFSDWKAGRFHFNV